MPYKPERIVTHNQNDFERMCDALKKSKHVKWRYESQGTMYAKDRNTPGNKEFVWENKVTHEKKIIRYERK